MKILYRNTTGNLIAIEASCLCVTSYATSYEWTVIADVTGNNSDEYLVIAENKSKEEAERILMELFETGRYLP